MFPTGVNPLTLRGHNVCVVAASGISDAEGIRFTEVDFVQGYGMVGHSRTMLSNRISYFFNVIGRYRYPTHSCPMKIVHKITVAKIVLM